MKPTGKFQSAKIAGVFLCLCLILVFQGCGSFRPLNRDKTILGLHRVGITPCGWKLEDKFGGPVKDEQTGKTYYKYSCGETVVTIKDEELVVNGKSYGKLSNATDSVNISDGRVLVNGKEVQAITETAVAGSGT
jgi:hypothetical protein